MTHDQIITALEEATNQLSYAAGLARLLWERYEAAVRPTNDDAYILLDVQVEIISAQRDKLDDLCAELIKIKLKEVKP